MFYFLFSFLMRNVINSSSSIETTKMRVLSLYNQLFWLLKSYLWFSGRIIDVQRGLIKNWNAQFWNYLDATHGKVEERTNVFSGIRCIKAILSWWEEIIFTHHSQNEQKDEWILYLDSLFSKLTDEKKVNLEFLLAELVKLEYHYFSWVPLIKKKTDCSIAETFRKRRWKWD